MRANSAAHFARFEKLIANSKIPSYAVCIATWQQLRRMCMQVSRAEFILLWMTFVAIIYTDLETGIFAGVVFSVFYFAYSYAKVHPECIKPVLGYDM